MQQHNRNILIILHRKGGRTGKIGQFLTHVGYQLDCRCIIAGDSLPDPANYRAVIVFGGMMSANDCQTIPAIAQEISWIPEVITKQVPYLGICLGAQLLARALGAGVARKPDLSVEIGYHLVTPTEAGQRIFPANGMRFYQWHVEGFSIAPNCQRLAQSVNFPNQAFCLNEKTIGLQFHPEATLDGIGEWVSREPEYLALAGAQSYKTQVELHRDYDPIVSRWLAGFLSDWLDDENLKNIVV